MMSVAPGPALTPPRDVSKSPRVTWLDSFRGISIILVVLGHVLGGLTLVHYVRESDRQSLQYVYDLFFTFRMPAMFLASGLFVARSLRRGLASFLADKTRTLAYSYLLWSFIGWIVHALTSRWNPTPADPSILLKILYDPWRGAWFLYVLFVLMVGYGLWASRGGGAWGFLAIASILHVLVPSWEAAPNLIALVSQHALYFGIGLVLADPIRGLGDRVSPRWLLVLVPISYALMKGSVALNFNTSAWLDLVPALFGTVGMFGLAMLLDRLPGAEFLHHIGRHSLQIYLASELSFVAARVFLVRGLGISALPIHILLGTVAGVLLPLVLVVICDAVGFRYMFTWPRPITPDPTNEEERASKPVPEHGPRPSLPIRTA